MTANVQRETSARVSVENIGGISNAEVSIGEGVTVLAGHNATNRTSFLRAIMAALGSENVSLKADATSGRVELEVGSKTYTRTLERKNGSVTFGGDPFLDDPTVADHYAFLLERNRARRAVAAGGEDLREIIMEPIDTAAIQAEIQQYEAKKRQLDEQIAALEDEEAKIPELKEEATRLERTIEDKREELEGAREAIADAEADLEETRQVKETLESKLQDVQSLRSEYETVEDRLATERESLDAVRAEKDSLEAELEDLPASVEDERESIRSELADLRSRKNQLEGEVSELQNLIQFNEEVFAGDSGLLTDFESRDGGDVTAQLVESGTVSCWTCGSEVERSHIDDTIERLRELREDKLSRVKDLETRIEERKAEQRTLEDRKQKRERTERQIAELEDEIEDRTANIERLEAEIEDLQEQIRELEGEIDDLELAEDHSELLELHQEANRLELEIERLEADRETVETEIEEVESAADRRADLEAERAAVADTLTDLRTKIERIETEAIEEFNKRIEEILALMDYDNIDRIWIERTAADGSAGSGPNPGGSFELHLVRSDASGTAYEDTVSNLSESEREVTGFVFALAGYLVHEVYEAVPFMLLDSLEALDSNRIAKLVEYFADHTRFLVVALLPEDAQALDDGYTRVTEI